MDLFEADFMFFERQEWAGEEEPHRPTWV